MALASCWTQVNNLPLSGRTIVITRALAQADEFTHELEQYGAQVIGCPTIETQELDDYERLDEAIAHLYGYDWLILTSVNAANYFFKRLAKLGYDASSLDELKVCVIGEATAERLGELHVHVDLIPNESKAEGVFAAREQFIGAEIFCLEHSQQPARAPMWFRFIALLCRRTWIEGEWRRCFRAALTASPSRALLQSRILLNSLIHRTSAVCLPESRSLVWVTLRRRRLRTLD